MPRQLKSRKQLDEEWAARKNARNAEKWSFWAAAGKLEDVVPTAKAQDIADWRRDYEDHRQAGKELNRRKAIVYRAVALAVLTGEEVDDHDDRIANVYPKDPVYACTTWCTLISKATGRTPGEVYAQVEAEYERQVAPTSDMVSSGQPIELAAEMRAAMLAKV